MTTTPTTDLASIPHPAGARSVDDWYDTASEAPGRYFTGQKWTISDGRYETEVLIDGTQRGDGSDQRFITLIDNGRECLCDMTSAQARARGLALIAAADEVDAAAVLR